MKLRDILKESEDRGLTSEVKKHFLEIVSTYNKYHESMDRKSDIIEVAETLGGITEAARELALREADDWFDKHTVKRNMSELTKLGSQFDKVAKEARNLDQRMHGLYEDMGNILSRYYKIGEITEDEMKQRLGMNESKSDCGCGCGGVTEGGCSTNISEGKHDKTLDKLADLVKGAKSFMDIGKELKKANIKDYHFSTSMLPMYVINIGGAKVAILNKKYADGAERIVGTTAIGLMESVIESLNEEPVAVSMRNDDGSITTTIKEVADLNEEESKLYEFGLKVEKALMNEKNCPTDPGKWAASKAAAKKKFDVYPSAYANGWAAKNYKGKGGGWRKCKG